MAPYCYLLPGGKNGWLFQELLDMFYYLQIISVGTESAINERRIFDRFVERVRHHESLTVSDITDYMRSVNYFPSDFEMKNMFREMELLRKEEVDFFDLVKLYINHKPVQGMRAMQLEKALVSFIKKFRSEDPHRLASYASMDVLERKDLLRILTEFGEKIDQKQAAMCLKEFFGIAIDEDMDECEMLARLPQKIKVQEFVDNLLGINLVDTVPVLRSDSAASID